MCASSDDAHSQHDHSQSSSDEPEAAERPRSEEQTEQKLLRNAFPGLPDAAILALQRLMRRRESPWPLREVLNRAEAHWARPGSLQTGLAPELVQVKAEKSGMVRELVEAFIKAAFRVQPVLLIPVWCSRVPALTSVAPNQDLHRGAWAPGASAELAIVGVNREVSQSGFLLGVYRCLHFLGFCKFGAGFNASSILQMSMQERMAVHMGFVKNEGEKELGRWSSLTRSNQMSVIQMTKIVESTKSGVQLQKNRAANSFRINKCRHAKDASTRHDDCCTDAASGHCSLDFN